MPDIQSDSLLQAHQLIQAEIDAIDLRRALLADALQSLAKVLVANSAAPTPPAVAVAQVARVEPQPATANVTPAPAKRMVGTVRQRRPVTKYNISRVALEQRLLDTLIGGPLTLVEIMAQLRASGITFTSNRAADYIYSVMHTQGAYERVSNNNIHRYRLKKPPVRVQDNMVIHSEREERKGIPL